MVKKTGTKKLTKAHLYAWIVSTCGPLTRDEITYRGWVLQIGRKPAYKKSSNISYFLPAPVRYYSDRPKEEWGCMEYDAERRYKLIEKTSLVCRGVLRVVGKRGRKLVYGLGPKGEKLAREYKEIINAK